MTNLLAMADWAALLGLLGLAAAAAVFGYLQKHRTGSPAMADFADQIRSGAAAFLRKQYALLAAFVAVAALLLLWGVGLDGAIAFVGGAVGSTLAVFSSVVAA